MKIFLLLILFIFSSKFIFSEEGWYRLNSPTNKEITSLDFIDENFGVICDDSNIYLTLDGGNSFQNIKESQAIDLNYYCLLILKNQDILVSGIQKIEADTYSNFIKRTTDLGLTWELLYSQKSISGSHFRNLQFCDEKIYFSSSTKGIKRYVNHDNFIEISDGDYVCYGSFWGSISFQTDIQTGAPKDFTLNIFKDSNFYSFFSYKYGSSFRGFLIYDNFWFVNDETGGFKSWDNGKTWNKITNSRVKTYGGGQLFFKQDTGYFYNYYNKIYKSNDFNIIVECMVPLNIPEIRIIKSVNKNIAYAVGDSGLILKTTDGGGVFVDEVEEEIKESQEIKITSSKNSSFSLELKYPPSEAKLELINILGVPLFSQSTLSQILNISLDPYPTGIYLLKYTDKQSTQVFKLLRE